MGRGYPWNVADISSTYFGIPKWVAGLILTVGVGLVILGGIKRIGDVAVLAYRIVYCLLILLTAQLIGTQHQLDLLSTFGTGLMLWANIPIMLIFGPAAMRAYKDYFRRYRAGTMQPHPAPTLIDTVGRKNIQR